MGRKQPPGSKRPRPWRIAFYFRPGMGRPPAIEFLESCPKAVGDQLLATTRSVSERPPPSFPAGLAWRPMRGKMDGIYEVRDRHGDRLYRLFCLLDGDAQRHHATAPLLVLLSGGEKAVGTAMDDDVYEDACRYRDDYLRSSPRAIYG